MSIFIREKDLRHGVRDAFREYDTGPVLIHTDLLRTGIVDRMKSREEICLDYERVLLDLLSNRSLLIPTFNYDFCRDGIYDLCRSRGQVGAFSVHIGEHYRHLRTRTPVFNFCIFDGNAFDRKEIVNPFGTDSAFGRLHSLDGTIAFLGADFETNTFLHYVEESLQVPYRYIKVFKGEIIENGRGSQWQIDYRVRPLEEGAAEYDWPRLTADLRTRGILKDRLIGNGHLLLYRAAELFDFWTSRMKADPLYLLTERSREVTFALYRRFGEPLTFEAVEVRKGVSPAK